MRFTLNLYFHGLDIDRGLFVFGPTTSIALSWGCWG
nr:MAG TPA: hypothetical protein [Bacteriophage sp.]